METGAGVAEETAARDCAGRGTAGCAAAQPAVPVRRSTTLRAAGFMGSLTASLRCGFRQKVVGVGAQAGFSAGIRIQSSG
ncbi:hypothetical protein ACTI_80030 [Actinoplanes sp. OR16]|nr:hypothetical protein ACTI_80030 [Actinoplanes sp. OR16]